MGNFYGNIQNPNKLQFYFDKMYPNRVSLEANKNTDGIYLNRHVLIEYTINPFKVQDCPFQAYPSDMGINYKTNYNEKNELIFIALYDGKKLFYEATRDIQKVTEENFLRLINYKIDQYSFGVEDTLQRGYDSTVWQKIYVGELEGQANYINIAELNALAPTFDFIYLLPSEKSIIPSIDPEKSTPLHYKIKVQPTWDIGIKKADEQHPAEKGGIDAIYFNKDGFKKEIRHKDERQNDYITFLNGKSERNIPYEKEGQQIPAEEILDKKELSIFLPSLGNAISDFWDIIYGEERQVDISWQTLKKEYEQNKENAFNSINLSTLRNCIQTFYSLLGYNIKIVENIQIESNLLSNILYYNKKDKKFYYINQKSKIEEAQLGNILACLLTINNLLGNSDSINKDSNTVYGILHILQEFNQHLGTVPSTIPKLTIYELYAQLNALYGQKDNLSTLINQINQVDSKKLTNISNLIKQGNVITCENPSADFIQNIV